MLHSIIKMEVLRLNVNPSQIKRLESILLSSVTVERLLEGLREVPILELMEFKKNTLIQALDLITENLALLDLVLNPITPQERLPFMFLQLLVDTETRLELERDGLRMLITMTTCDMEVFMCQDMEVLTCNFINTYNSLLSNTQIIVHNVASYLQRLTASCMCSKEGGYCYER